jgi:hypothetical protein
VELRDISSLKTVVPDVLLQLFPVISFALKRIRKLKSGSPRSPSASALLSEVSFEYS